MGICRRKSKHNQINTAMLQVFIDMIEMRLKYNPSEIGRILFCLKDQGYRQNKLQFIAEEWPCCDD